MKLTSENLVVLTRPALDNESREVLIGRKKRGRFAGYDIFPGGKLEDAEPQTPEACRELAEETGIVIPPDALRYAAKLLILDKRPGNERFGNVTIFAVDSDNRFEAIETDELEPRWMPVEDPTVTDNMPPDARAWWPTVRLPDQPFTVTHIIYETDGSLEVITKEPDYAHTPGAIIYSERFPASE